MKYISIIAFCVSVSAPCMHEVKDENHERNHINGLELCTSSDHTCHCHSCEDLPCPDTPITIDYRLSLTGYIGFRPSHVLLFTLSESGFTPALCFSDRTDTLRRLQTVRLLI